MPRKNEVEGLQKRGNTWWIWTRKVRKSCKTGDLKEAKRYKAKVLLETRNAELYGERPRRTFDEAAAKFVKENAQKKSLERDIQALEKVMPYIGHITIDLVHDGTLQPYTDDRLEAGISQGTVNRDLAVVRRILRLAADKWRDENGLSWLERPPLISMPEYKGKKSHVLSWTQQRKFFQKLPDHLAEMALFDVNTGAREHEVCGLKWEWELEVEKGVTIFVIPEEETKKGVERVIVLNRIAQSVVDRQRGKHDTYVFTYGDDPLAKMYTSAWKRAWRAACLPTDKMTRKGPHNLRHTVGHRLRAAGVPKEDRRDLLGHVNQDITTHYSAAEVNMLREYMERLCDLDKKSLRTVKSIQSDKRLCTV
ncbi:MAG: tyrosine-type recombinase/integrase [Pseudomonadota bacterium]